MPKAGGVGVGILGVMAKGCGVYFWGNKNVLKFVIVVVEAQSWE